MKDLRPMLVTLSLLALPLAFSVGLSGERGQPKVPRTPAEARVQRPRAAQLPERASTATAPLRIVRTEVPRTERRVGEPRVPVELPREARAESLARAAIDPKGGGVSADDYGLEPDPERAEKMEVAASAAVDLEEYGANTE